MSQKQPRFAQLETVAPTALAEFLMGQMPLLAAVVLNHLSPAHTAKVLANLPADLQHEIVSSMGKARQTPPEVLDSLEDGLLKKAATLVGNPPAAPARAPQPYAPASPSREQQDDPLARYAWKPRTVSDVTPANPSSATSLPGGSLDEIISESQRSGLGNPSSIAGARSAYPSRPQPDLSQAKPAFSNAPVYPPQPAVPTPSSRPSSPVGRGTGTPTPLSTPSPAANRPRPPAAIAVPGRNKPADKQAALRGILDQIRAQSGKPSKARAHRVDGMALAAEILRYASPEIRHRVRDAEPRLYERLHDRMFVFEDLGSAPKEALGVVFTEFDLSRSALALRFASERLQQRALEAVSPRRAALLREEMQHDDGRVRISEVEGVQQEAIEFAMALQSEGRILIDAADPDLA